MGGVAEGVKVHGMWGMVVMGLVEVKAGALTKLALQREREREV